MDIITSGIEGLGHLFYVVNPFKVSIGNGRKLKMIHVFFSTSRQVFVRRLRFLIMSVGQVLLFTFVYWKCKIKKKLKIFQVK